MQLPKWQQVVRIIIFPFMKIVLVVQAAQTENDVRAHTAPIISFFFMLIICE